MRYPKEKELHEPNFNIFFFGLTKNIQKSSFEIFILLFLAQHRALESRWHAKKIKLHQRLALRLFQEDVKQVLDWLQNHGEVFLRKNIGIGRNLAKARAYQKSHETFEGENIYYYYFLKIFYNTHIYSSQFFLRSK